MFWFQLAFIVCLIFFGLVVFIFGRVPCYWEDRFLLRIDDNDPVGFIYNSEGRWSVSIWRRGDSGSYWLDRMGGEYPSEAEAKAALVKFLPFRVEIKEKQ